MSNQGNQKHQPLAPEIRDSLPSVNVDDLIVSIKYYVDEEFAHIKIKEPAVCSHCKEQPCLDFCPVQVFSSDGQGRILVGYQACVECGSCRIGCPMKNVDWSLPLGGHGVAYKFG